MKQIYISKGKQAWLLPISAWLGICKDGARDAGYAFPDDCEVPNDTIVAGDMLAIQIDNWMKADFAGFLSAYERGDIKPPKETRIVGDVAPEPAPAPVDLEIVIVDSAKPKVKRTKKK